MRAGISESWSERITISERDKGGLVWSISGPSKIHYSIRNYILDYAFPYGRLVVLERPIRPS
jgi:hypothetical protein